MLNVSNSTGMDYLHDYDDDDYDNMYLFNISQWNFTNTSDYDHSSGWCEADEIQEFIIKTFQTCVFCLIFLLGVLGNCLVIATYARYRRLHLRSMTDIFLFHLSIADLLLLFTLPLQAVDTHLGWVFPSFLCTVTRASYAINTYSGILLLACISVDRYMVVAKAQQMLRLRRGILTAGKVAAVIVWCFAALLSLPELIYSGVLETEHEAYCGVINNVYAKKLTNGAIIFVFCLSFLVMITCYSLVAKALCGGHTVRKGKQGHHQRTLKLMVALVLVFLGFQLPYTVVLSQKIAGQFCSPLLEYITCTLAYTRCCLNPILYALVGIRFRTDVVRLFYNSKCPCWRIYGVPQTISSTSMSPISPALTVLTACSPTAPEPSYSSNDTPPHAKFHFPG